MDANVKRSSLFLRLSLVAGSLLFSSCKTAVLEPVPSWAYPTNPSLPPGATPPAVPQGPFQLPNSKQSFTRAQLSNLFAAPDWHPEGHAPMPEVVAQGRQPEVRACAYCHLPTGNGRPENARLAGLPVNYFVEQMKAFRDGSRKSSVEGRAPTVNMSKTAKAITDAEIWTAAKYFAALPPQSYVRVEETEQAPKAKVAGWLYQFDPTAGKEPLGQRILEGPEDFETFELRNPETKYVAYVPVGSVAEGKRFAETWGEGKSLECSSCHGPGYRGKDDVPGIAGRSPTSLMRQLYDFKSKARRGGKSSEMDKVVEYMTNNEMLALSAYLATLRP